MKSLYSLAAFLSLALLVNCIDARKDSGEYWRQGHDLSDNGHSKPRLSQGLVHVAKATSVSDEKKGDCKHDSVEPSLTKDKQLLTSDFDPRPSVTAYVADLKPNDKQSYTKDFEPRPNIFFYANDGKQEDGKSTAYAGDLKPNDKQSYTKDFEPRPNLFFYANDGKQEDGKSTAYAGDLKPNDKQSYTKDFEPRPNLFFYTNDGKQEDGKSLVTDFEPRPNISAYDNHANAEKVAEENEKGLEDGKNYKI